MSSSIPDYGAALPKQYRTPSADDIKQLGIKKLFRMVVLGPSFSDKNNLCMYILKHSPNCFSHLHIIARNSDQELYRYLQDKLSGFITVHDPDNPPSLDTIRKTKEGGVELVIIGDYSNDRMLMERLFSHYFTTGRHHKLSTICLIHSYFACPKMIRLNSELVAILKSNSKRDIKQVQKDFNIPGMSDDRMMRAYERCTAKKGQCLLLDSVKGQVRSNFDRVIDPESLGPP